MDSTPWYQEVWFVIVVVLVLLLLLFVVLTVVCLRYVGVPSEARIRQRMPLPPPRQKLTPRDIVLVVDEDDDAFTGADGVNAGPGIGVVNPVFSTPTNTPASSRRRQHPPPPSPSPSPSPCPSPSPSLSSSSSSSSSYTADSEYRFPDCRHVDDEDGETDRVTEMVMIEMTSRETGDGDSVNGERGTERGEVSNGGDEGTNCYPVPAKRKKRMTLTTSTAEATGDNPEPTTSRLVTTHDTIIPATAV